MAVRGVSINVQYLAWDVTNNVPKLGDQAQHSINLVKDGVAAASTNTPTQVDSVKNPGLYNLVLTVGEATADITCVHGKSATAGVYLFPVSISFHRLPNADPATVGGLPTVNASNLIAGIVGTVQSLDTLQTNVLAKLPSALTGAGFLKADILALNGDLTAAQNLAKSAKAIIQFTVGAASTTTQINLSASSPAIVAADQFKGLNIHFDSLTTTTQIRSQGTDIQTHTAGGVLTVTALTTPPVAGDFGTIS